MAKKNVATAVIKGQIAERSAISTNLALGDAERALAVRLGIDLAATEDERLSLAVTKTNRAVRLIVEAGVLFLSIKDECEHGAFTERLDQIGVAPQRAREAMAMAQALARMPADRVDQFLSLPKTKAMALAAADPLAVEAMLEDGDIDIDLIGVRALRSRIRELEAAVADREVQLETAEAEAKAAKKAAKKDRDSEVPVAIFDIRAEAVAQVERSRLAVDEVLALGRDLVNLIEVDGVYQWVDPTARLAAAGLIALQVQIEGALKQFKKAFDLADVKPAPMSYLTPGEVEEAAKRFADLIAIHQHEKALREWERQQERPRGKGRPAAKPEAPKTRAE